MGRRRKRRPWIEILDDEPVYQEVVEVEPDSKCGRVEPRFDPDGGDDWEEEARGVE